MNEKKRKPGRKKGSVAKKKRVRITVSLWPELRDWILKQADRSGSTRSKVVEKIVEKVVQSESKS